MRAYDSIRFSCITMCVLLSAARAGYAQAPVGSAITYQGQLKESGAPADGVYDLQFKLFDAAVAGGQVGSTVCFDGVVPVDGLFTLPLDFGAAAFDGNARWLEIGVRVDATAANCSAGVYTTFATRQPLTAAPYALYALNGPGGSGLWAANGAAIHNTNTGNVGIGTSMPAHRLDVAGDVRGDGRAAFGNDGVIGVQASYDRLFDFSHTIADFSSSNLWTPFNSVFRVNPSLDLTGPNASYLYGHNFEITVPAGNPHDVEYMQGPYIYAGNNGGGNVNVLVGAFISAQSNGDAVEHVGCEIGAWGLGASANIRNNYALSLRTGQLHAGGTIDNNYALYIGAPENPVAIQNSTGIYMADQTVAGATDNWAIYSDGGRSYFADTVNIGATFASPYKLVAVNETEHAIFGKVEANSGSFAYGVYGQSDSASGGGGVFGIAPVHGVHGLAVATTGTARGGLFTSNSTDGEGVFGYASAETGLNYGVRGRTDSPAGFAGYFEGRGYFSSNVGIGTTSPATPLHVAIGTDAGIGGGGFLVLGDVAGANIAIDNNELMARNNGVASDFFINHNGGDVLIGAGGGVGNVGIGTNSPTRGRVDIAVANQRGIYGSNNSATFATAIFENAGTGPAGVFNGNVTVIGTLSKSGGSFRIDHPLDPANKYLYHSFVESPDMKNLYDGVAVTDDRGYATVEMPDWFEPLNRDFRYQLTVIDAADGDEFVQAKIVREIADRKFSIRTSRGGVKVSWQVTGTRHDPWAEAHRIPIEEEKPAHLRGTYQHPELYGHSREMGESNAVLQSSGGSQE